MSPSPLLASLLATTALLTSTFAADEPYTSRPWNRDTLYFTLTDRFFDADPDNDVPAGSPPALHDPAQKEIGKYHGGDLRGLELALQFGYFRDLGITALWISPPVKNVWNSSYDLGGAKTGYHGYWAQDFLDIDPHLTSRRSLDGQREYPDTRDGRMQHYRDFVALAHAQNIKIVQDIVCNHTGPNFFYDANGNGKFDATDQAEWIQPYQRDGFHDNAKWADVPAFNQVRTEPSGPLTVLGRDIKTTGILAKLDTYSRKGFSNQSLGKNDGEEINCDFFSLRDIWTAPGSAHFDALVKEFVEIYAFYIETIGIDGFRIDTVKHVHHAFWDAFTAKLRARLGPERAKRLLLFGEVYDGNPAKLGEYTYRLDFPAQKEPCLDAVLNFSFCFTAREYLRRANEPFGPTKQLEWAFNAPDTKTNDRPNFNPEPGPDGLTAHQKVVNFVENHDGLNRFRVAGISEKQNLLAQALTMTVEGIPCLYYGTESSLLDEHGKIGRDSETGRLTFIPQGHPETFDTVRKSASFRAIALLNRMRKFLPALTDGALAPLWSDSPAATTDDGVLAFARYLPAPGDAIPREAALVVINASDQPRQTVANETRMKLITRTGQPLLREGERLMRLPIAALYTPGSREQSYEVPWKNGLPEIDLTVPPQSINIYRIQRPR